MPVVNFKKQFVQAVKSGKKKQTIRLMRKRPLKQGDTLFLYTGMRTKQCHHVMSCYCKKIEHIIIKGRGLVYINSVELDLRQTKILARKNGFGSMHEFYNFFAKNNRMPFIGQVIYW